jgi:hypothetical protein
MNKKMDLSPPEWDYPATFGGGRQYRYFMKN